MKRLCCLLLLLPIFTAAPARPPRLVVQIVVGSMRAGDLDRYADRFGEGGFRRLLERGSLYTDCRYNFQLTTTPATLATLATGAMPSMHGVVGESWIDYTTNRPVHLTDGPQGAGGYELIAPTLAETLCSRNPAGRAVSVALESTPAVLLAGRTGNAYWVDDERGEWATSRYYASATPAWVERLNTEGFNIGYLIPVWQQLLVQDAYRNTQRHDIRLTLANKRSVPLAAPRRFTPRTYTERLRYTPAGNSAVLGFAKQAVAHHELGTDEQPDLLNIYLDASRRIAELYGPESVEVEDTYYRLDRDLADFLDFLYAQVSPEECLVVLTSDHGTSDACNDEDRRTERFNAQQFRVIVNGFLNVRYGTGAWVQSYKDRSLYLNRNLIYERNLDLGKVQSEVATFATQFSGVAHALSATALSSGSFGRGYAMRMQNSFYPRRSGDVVLNLMPGRIEEQELVCSASGSMYAYDTQVPLVFCGPGIPARRIRREVDATDVAPTLARLLEIAEPDASEGAPLPEIIE